MHLPARFAYTLREIGIKLKASDNQAKEATATNSDHRGEGLG